MAHCAEIHPETKEVLRVIVTSDTYGALSCEEWCAKTYGGIWKKTSYNTHAGKHPENRPFRKNYAAIGYKYDEVRDAFIPPKQKEDLILDEETCQWVEPSKTEENGL